MKKENGNSIKRVTTSIRIDPELWHRAKIYALENHMNIGEFLEKLLEEKLHEKELSKKK
jgi:predicted DNA-binding ribbon-helix-helix protein